MGRRKIWFFIAIYVLVIYATLPFAPYFVDALRFIFGENYGYILSGAIFFSLILIARKSFKLGLTSREKFWLFYLIFAGAIVTLSMDIPAERIHFLEYGILGFLLTRAIRKDMEMNPKIYITAFVLGSIIGFLDEVIQKFLQVQSILPLPRRYFEWKDIAMNVFGIFLGLVFSRYVIDKTLERSR